MIEGLRTRTAVLAMTGVAAGGAGLAGVEVGPIDARVPQLEAHTIPVANVNETCAAIGFTAVGFERPTVVNVHITDTDKDFPGANGPEVVVSEQDSEITVPAGTSVQNVDAPAPVGTDRRDATFTWNGGKNSQNAGGEVDCGEVVKTPPQPTGETTPVDTPTPAESVVVTTPGQPSTPARPVTPHNNSPRITFKKDFNGASPLVRDGKIVKFDGETVERVRPGQVFNLSFVVRSKDDGDKIKGEKVTGTITDALPMDGTTPLMYAKNPKTGEFNVIRLSRRVTVTEGHSKRINIPVTSTRAAATPPRFVDNLATFRFGKKEITDIARFYDPMSRTAR